MWLKIELFVKLLRISAICKITLHIFVIFFLIFRSLKSFHTINVIFEFRWLFYTFFFWDVELTTTYITTVIVCDWSQNYLALLRIGDLMNKDERNVTLSVHEFILLGCTHMTWKEMKKTECFLLFLHDLHHFVPLVTW